MDKRVEIHGTTSADMNGKRGVATDYHFDREGPSKSRYTVQLDAGEAALRELIAPARSAKAVIGALGDKGECQAELWTMLLTYLKAFPAAWTAMDARKAVLPRLWANIRAAAAGDRLLSAASWRSGTALVCAGAGASRWLLLCSASPRVRGATSSQLPQLAQAERAKVCAR